MNDKIIWECWISLTQWTLYFSLHWSGCLVASPDNFIFITNCKTAQEHVEVILLFLNTPPPKKIKLLFLQGKNKVKSNVNYWISAMKKWLCAVQGPLCLSPPHVFGGWLMITEQSVSLEGLTNGNRGCAGKESPPGNEGGEGERGQTLKLEQKS